MRLFEKFDRWVDKQQLKALRQLGIDLEQETTLPVLNLKESAKKTDTVPCDYCGQPRKLKKTCDSCGGKPSGEEFK